MRVLPIVPAYQAGRTVGEVVRGLAAIWPPSQSAAQVLVIDDGSTDDTAERAREAGAEVVRHSENRGKGAALTTGLQRALELGVEAVVSVDADGQHPPREALRLAEHPAPFTALVLGIRDLEGAGAPRANRTSNAISNFFLSGFSGRRLLDTQCGLRRYPVAETLSLGIGGRGSSFEAEAVLRAARAGWRIEQVPVLAVYPPEHERTTHFHVVRDPAKIVVRVVATLWSLRGSK